MIEREESLEEGAALADDWACVKCRHNLRGVSRGERCPNCRLPASTSVDYQNNLKSIDIQRLWRGSALIVGYFLATGGVELWLMMFAKNVPFATQPVAFAICCVTTSLLSSAMLFVGMLQVWRCKRVRRGKLVGMLYLSYPWVRVAGALTWAIMALMEPSYPQDFRRSQWIAVTAMGAVILHQLLLACIHLAACWFMRDVARRLMRPMAATFSAWAFCICAIGALLLACSWVPEGLKSLSLAWESAPAWLTDYVWRRDFEGSSFFPDILLWIKPVIFVCTLSMVLYWIGIAGLARSAKHGLPKWPPLGLVSDPATDPPNLSFSDPITINLPCVQCGYNIQTKSHADLCPECATAVQDSLDYASQRGRYRLGCLRGGIGLAAVALGVGLAGILLEFRRPTILLVNTPITLWLADIAAGFASLATLLLVASRHRPLPRHLIRGVISISLMFGIVLMQFDMTVYYYSTRTLWTQTWAQPVAQFLLCLALFAALYGFMMNFSREMGSRMLAISTRVTFGMAGLCILPIAVWLLRRWVWGYDWNQAMEEEWTFFAKPAVALLTLYCMAIWLRVMRAAGELRL